MKILDQDLHIECDALFVNQVHTNSGIFIGNNYSHSWSSHTKTNSGLGTTSSCDISNILNIVFDNDMVDTLINEENNTASLPITSNTNQDNHDQYDIHTINVNAINTNSTLTIGENRQPLWSSHNKLNFGIGNLSGFNYVKQTLNQLNDQDLIDTPISNRSNNQN